MPRHKRQNCQDLLARIEENRRLVLKTRDLAHQIDQGFAAVKDAGAKAHRPRAAKQWVSPAVYGRYGILIVEDHPVVSQGLAGLLNYEPDLHVCGVAPDMTLALQLVEEAKPDLVILDLSLKECSGFDVLEQIKRRFPTQLVLILSWRAESIYALPALQAGACGYVMKQEATDVLLRAVREVLAGKIFLSPGIKSSVIQRLVGYSSAPDPAHRITGREREVLSLIRQGSSSRSIAHVLGISIRTIETHRRHLREKLGLKTAAELVQFAIQSPALNQ
jgi:DNA-binding NarL/FixJ family response regulator